MWEKQITSTLALNRSFESVRKALNFNSSRDMFQKARLHGRANGPGADPPFIKVKVLAFTEGELKKWLNMF